MLIPLVPHETSGKDREWEEGRDGKKVAGRGKQERGRKETGESSEGRGNREMKRKRKNDKV